MIFSKSNNVKSNTFTTNASVTSGSAENVRDADFSKNLVTSSANFNIDCGSTTLSEYVGIHGLDLPVGTVVNLRDGGGGVLQTYTTTRASSNIVFYLSSPISFSNLRVNIVGSGQKIVSYIQAGEVAVVDWGVSGGQSLAYFANNIKSRATVNQRGQPTNNLTEKISPKLSLSINNPTKEWIRGELQEVFEHYNDTGIVSIRDYENDAFPDESVAAFELSNDKVNAHNASKTITNVKLMFRVSV